MWVMVQRAYRWVSSSSTHVVQYTSVIAYRVVYTTQYGTCGAIGILGGQHPVGRHIPVYSPIRVYVALYTGIYQIP